MQHKADIMERRKDQFDSFAMNKGSRFENSAFTFKGLSAVKFSLSFGAVFALLTGCTRKDGPCEVIQARPLLRYHRAAAGENLADIAQRYDMSVQELCRLNNFTTTFALVPGQKVFVIPPKDNGAVIGAGRTPSITVETASSGFTEEEERNAEDEVAESLDGLGQTPPHRAEGPQFIWPVKGRLLRRFKDPLPNGTLSDGINISAPINTPIRAIADGTVMDAGELVLGFGKMVLILHDSGLLSIYSHLQEISVRKGDTVTRSQVIGRVGKTGNVRVPQLHFQLRNSAKTLLDPLKILPGEDEETQE